PSAIRPRSLIFAEISNALEKVRDNGGPAIDTTFFMLLVSGLSKFWVTVQERMLKRLNYDTLCEENLAQFQKVLTGLTTDLMSGRYLVSDDRKNRPSETRILNG